MLVPVLISTIMGAGVGWLAYAVGDLCVQGIDLCEQEFAEKLRRLRVGTRNLRRWLVAWLVVVTVTLWGMWIILDSPVIGVSLAVLLVCVPWYTVRRMAENRRQKIEDQLADSMVSLSSGIRAGLSLGQSLEILADQSPQPVAEEFRQIVGEFQLGKPLERCLTEARDRLRSENFALFSAAILASRESGGRLNETVERIAHSVLEMQRLERKIISETAQARTSAVYMAAAPLVILLVYWLLVDPENTERLFTTLPGQILLCTSLLLNIIAYVWARAIMNPDI